MTIYFLLSGLLFYERGDALIRHGRAPKGRRFRTYESSPEEVSITKERAGPRFAIWLRGRGDDGILEASLPLPFKLLDAKMNAQK